MSGNSFRKRWNSGFSSGAHDSCWTTGGRIVSLWTCFCTRWQLLKALHGRTTFIRGWCECTDCSTRITHELGCELTCELTYVGNPTSDSQPFQTASDGMLKLFVPSRVPRHAWNASNYLDHYCSLHIWGCGPSAAGIAITSPAKYGIFGKCKENTRIWHFDSLEMTWP